VKLLITGGHGFLGRHLVEHLQAEGCELVLTSRKSREDRRPGVQVCQVDLTEAKTLQHLPRGVDAIIHTAACIPSKQHDSGELKRFWETNALGTLHLVEWAGERGIKTFIYCSSMSVYAPDSRLPVMEETTTYPMGNAWAYGLSKLGGEIICANFQRSMQRRVFSLRFSTLYGNGMLENGVLAVFLKCALAGEPLEVHGLNVSGDFLYVKDAAAAIVLALESACDGGIFNIGSGIETNIRELAEIVRDVVPRAGKSEIKVTESLVGRRFCMDISKARRDLGFEPQYTLRSGLTDWLQHGA